VRTTAGAPTITSTIRISSQSVFHGLLAIAGAGAFVSFAMINTGSALPPIDLLYGLTLTATTFAIYAWLVYPTTIGVLANGLAAFCILWTWAAQQMPTLGWHFAAWAVLLGAAVMQRRRRSRRLLRLRQQADDVDEERTLKHQAIELAKQTHDGLVKKHARYAQLQSIAEQLSNLLTLEEIGQLAVDRTFELIGKSDACLLFLIDAERQELALAASRKGASVASIHTKHGDQFDRYVLRTHRPLLVNDVRRDFRFTSSGISGRQIGSVIACPLLREQNAEGVLRLDSAQAAAYTQDDLRFLDILLDLVATAVANAKLFHRTQQLAMTDGLTGLLLRRPFQEALSRELARAGRGRETSSVLLMDLDSFKTYNDTYGHTAGDAVLISTADVLRETVPPEGVSARYGGEEFAVLLPRASRESARQIAEKIREAVERDLKKVSRSERAAVTVSIGVATVPEDAKAELELIRVADQRLYAAKHAGRNRVCASS